MGFFKKIFKPVAKVLDKVIPNEIKPALPYLAALAPVFAPAGMQGLIGSTVGRRALTSGLLNIGAQLSQEGSEGDINLLSAGLGALTGAMTTPADPITGQTSADFFRSKMTPTGSIKDIATDTVISAKPLTTMQQATNFGLEGLAKGSEMFAAGAAKPFSMAGAKAATLPLATATGDVMEAQARQLEKQAAIDAALAEAEALADSGLRGDAIRNAMRSYGFFTDEEIEDTVSSAGYKAGGRVGFKFGGIDEAIDKIETEKITELVKSDKGGLDSVKDKMAGMGNVMKLFERDFGGFDRAGFEDMLIQYSDSGAKAKGVKLMDFALDFLGISSMKDGGLMNLGGKEMDLRGGGFVPIGKKERADDVPARLSKNEFVMTADAVRAAGGGSVNKGAKRMYNLMNTLEARA